MLPSLSYSRTYGHSSDVNFTFLGAASRRFGLTLGGNSLWRFLSDKHLRKRAGPVDRFLGREQDFVPLDFTINPYRTANQLLAKTVTSHRLTLEKMDREDRIWLPRVPAF